MKRRFDATTDLQIEREIAVPTALVWDAWTQPEHLKKWFCPKPWHVTECEIDLRPGGVFHFKMQGPNGEKQEFTTCYLEVVKHERLIWSTVMRPGFRPAPVATEPPDFTAIVEFTSLGAAKTKYVATAMHRDRASRDTHDKMGFTEGWGTATEQLVRMLGG
ncbi:MAG: SRPBCC family protein [Archangium sp.]